MRRHNDLIAELRASGTCKPLSEEANRQLLERVAAGDSEAREKMIRGNVALVCVRVEWLIRHRPYLEHLHDDLISCGVIGVTKAINNIAKGKQVTTVAPYLSYWIYRELMRLHSAETQNGPMEQDDTSVTEIPEDIGYDDSELSLLELRDAIYTSCESDQERELVALRERGQDIAFITEWLGISRATTYRMLRRIEQRYQERYA